MVALSFKPQFRYDIEIGWKRRTIRQVRKSGNPAAGKPLQLYVGLRTKQCQKIRDAICTRVRPVIIDYHGIILDGRRLYAGHALAKDTGVNPEEYDGDFAHADGFDSFHDMVDFFECEYGLPFRGQLIEWKLGK